MLSKQEQLSLPSRSPVFLFLLGWNGILQDFSGQSWADFSKGSPGFQGPCQAQGMLLALPVLVTTIMEAVWHGQRKRVLLLNLIALPEASKNKGHLIIEFLFRYL
jgi:hypothetical protein